MTGSPGAERPAYPRARVQVGARRFTARAGSRPRPSAAPLGPDDAEPLVRRVRPEDRPSDPDRPAHLAGLTRPPGGRRSAGGDLAQAPHAGLLLRGAHPRLDQPLADPHVEPRLRRRRRTVPDRPVVQVERAPVPRADDAAVLDR